MSLVYDKNVGEQLTALIIFSGNSESRSFQLNVN